MQLILQMQMTRVAARMKLQPMQIAAEFAMLDAPAETLRQAADGTAHDGQLAENRHQAIELSDVDADGCLRRGLAHELRRLARTSGRGKAVA